MKGEATIMISLNGWRMLHFESYPNWTITFLPINTKKHFISLYVNDINVVWLR